MFATHATTPDALTPNICIWGLPKKTRRIEIRAEEMAEIRRELELRIARMGTNTRRRTLTIALIRVALGKPSGAGSVLERSNGVTN